MIIREKSLLKKKIDEAKTAGKSVLIKKGVFDIIHPGHIYAMKMFGKMADVVVILIQSDELTQKRKGDSRPVNPQLHRAEVVDGLDGVDYVFLDKCSSREDYVKLLNYLKPTIVSVTSIDKKKTSAYSSQYWELRELLDKKKPGYSTTEIINRCQKK